MIKFSGVYYAEAKLEFECNGMRWSMTETHLALTIFREEVSLNVGGIFQY